MPFQQVNHFMGDNIFYALHGLLGEFQIEPDSFGFGVACTPFGFHLSDTKFGDGEGHLFFESNDIRGNQCLELAPVPFGKKGLPFLDRGLFGDIHIQGAMLQDYFGRAVLFYYPKQVAFAQEIVALSWAALPDCFTVLALEFGLLFAYPGSFGNKENPDGFGVHSQWGRDFYFALGWINAKVDVLYILANYLYGNIAQDDCLLFSIHFVV